MSLAGLGQSEHAVRLSSAARAELVRRGVNMKVRSWDALVERYITPARAALGTARAESVARLGSEMSFENAIADALALAQR